ncbi:N-acetyllactosaminide beta-1,3-N-acetylglucosaminyltransferase 2-like [Brienomyrus brachyistius]|uniref:N-acetyllactosaminide beta-1,3-N-acetylglucosaminyltransferase 2-like n=1 Tax=Brienomyrus brachyistius TaxID=42636 RepID=UPI0020B2C319|nr:N-acetyllactosaminide beta-1,3-N-acetylglucosaminyltransferase 2-like [Brienomyrus brachyistius]XP_048840546.1 N-acetyllactosaminide beta-1,3-N-acetylglucosaminyltransferase 2-like [Brienomyrus brachyistius]
MILRMIRLKKIILAITLMSGLAVFLYYSLRSKRDVSLGMVLQATTLEQAATDQFEPDQDNNVVITVSEAFRQAFAQKSSYWSRRQNALLQKLDKMNTSNMTRNKFSRPKCSPSTFELMRANIGDFDSYPEMYKNFLVGMNCRDSRIVIDQPNKCKNLNGEGRPYLLIAIKSESGNFLQRQAIRNTWGRQGSYGDLTVRTIFLLGTSSTQEPSLQRLLDFEGKYFSDLLQWEFQETFYNRALKDALFLEWILTQCPRVTFIFSGYDDIFINTAAILRYLQSLTPEKAAKLYAGHLNTDSNPVNDPQEKYYVPPSFYDGSYPAYATGAGFLLSGSLVKPLHRISVFIPFFPIDDVYTGICLQALGVEPEMLTGFETGMQVDDTNVCLYKDLLLMNNRNPQKILTMWKNINSPLLVC